MLGLVVFCFCHVFQSLCRRLFHAFFFFFFFFPLFVCNSRLFLPQNIRLVYSRALSTQIYYMFQLSACYNVRILKVFTLVEHFFVVHHPPPLLHSTTLPLSFTFKLSRYAFDCRLSRHCSFCFTSYVRE